MNRIVLTMLLGLFAFALPGCGRGAPDPTGPAADRSGGEVPDAQLQLAEEDEHRTREAQANADARADTAGGTADRQVPEVADSQLQMIEERERRAADAEASTTPPNVQPAPVQ